MKWYKAILAPVALVYGAGVMIRNGLYKSKLLRSKQVGLPTICVGNLAVGGTGKTPFVEYLIRMLGAHYKIAVLSRGYRRRTRGFILADDQATALTIGDEPMQIHEKFPDIPVAVCADRVEGVRKLQEHCEGLQAVILDDAFQHRQIRCGYNILLTAYDNLYIDDHFLPMGRLRDARRESLRAAAVVVTKCPETLKPIDRRIVDTKLHLPTFQQLCFSYVEYEDMPVGKKVLLVTGIAHPEYIYEALKKQNKTTTLLDYPDHYRYTERDLRMIEEKARPYDMVVTTEKDYVKMQTVQMGEELIRKLRALSIRITLTNAENLERGIRQYINENLQPKKK